MSFSDEGARQPGKLVSLAHNKNSETKDQAKRGVREGSPSSALPQAEGGWISCFILLILRIKSQCQPATMPTWHSQKY